MISSTGETYNIAYGDVFYRIPNVDIKVIPYLTNWNQRYCSFLSIEQSSGNTAPQSPITLALLFIAFLRIHDHNEEHKRATAKIVFDAVQKVIQKQGGIANCLRHLSDSSQIKKRAFAAYWCYKVDGVPEQSMSNGSGVLCKGADVRSSRIYMIFGGQGPSNSRTVADLRELFSLYRPLVEDFIRYISPVLLELSQKSDANSFLGEFSIDINNWLSEAESLIPDESVLASAPYSMPLIGLLGLTQYLILTRLLQQKPGQITSSIQGITGHSQGLIVATAVARSDTWSAFFANARTAVTILFWIGYESHLAARRFPMPDRISCQESIKEGFGHPSCMMSVRGLNHKKLDGIIKEANQSQPPENHVSLAIVNSWDSFAVSGPPQYLWRFSNLLKRYSAPVGIDQTKVPFSLRSPVIFQQFLPVSAPFHSQHLIEAAAAIKNRITETFSTESLETPVYHSRTGEDIRDSASLVNTLVDAITVEKGNWPSALCSPDATHIVSFADKGVTGLVSQLEKGKGSCIMDTTEFNVLNPEQWLFPESRNSLSWAQCFQPRLTRNSDGCLALQTKFTELFKVPHVMVAGMTPTTTHPDFVAAIINAGYHGELAGGGYFEPTSFTAAIRTLTASIPKGQGITINLIYASPRLIAWQIPLIGRLIREGVAIDGLTIGAGVPSLTVAKEYILTLGIKHIAFKPGSVNAILQVLEIAKAFPLFPVILQWTGGRGGGHHSFEDFHEPIIQTYDLIRQHSNIILIAGSGFGDAVDSYKYMSGTWSTEFERPRMPFDGILLGSRLMVAKEAHTSIQAKTLILEATGTDDWEKTYTQPAGGVMTVKSEMGEPIHKLATRAVRLWAELDDKIFRLPRKSQKEEIQKNKSWIIDRLNKDFAKPWFGRNSLSTNPVELEEMTYTEVLSRLVQLMYLPQYNRWVHNSYTSIVSKFAERVVERFSLPFVVLGEEEIRDNPHGFLVDFLKMAGKAETTFLRPDDAAFFLSICRLGNHKPVNFIPVLDEDFEYWFKKDSLWQSEDIDAVPDGDAERVFILHGPLAAKYSKRMDETAKDILDSIREGHISMLQQEKDVVCNETPSSDRIDNLEDFLCKQDFILQGSKKIPNPFKRVFDLCSTTGFTIEQSEDSIVIRHDVEDRSQDSFMIQNIRHESTISVSLNRTSKLSTSPPFSLSFFFTYDEATERLELAEDIDSRTERIRRLYLDLWSIEPQVTENRLKMNFENSSQTILTRKLLESLLSTVRIQGYDMHHTGSFFPLDILVLVAWKVLVAPILQREANIDLLQLVHQSNTSEYLPDVTPLRVGDTITTSATLQGVTIGPSGKSFQVLANIQREGETVARVSSTFLVRGVFQDYDNTFSQIEEPDIEINVNTAVDEAILRNYDWISLDNPEKSLQNNTLIFRIVSSTKWANQDLISSMEIRGVILAYKRHLWPRVQVQKVGNISYTAKNCRGENPVLEVLLRRGQYKFKKVALDTPGWPRGSQDSLEFIAPKSNDSYAFISKDFNPIHSSTLFARWVGLPGIITHGMFTACLARAALTYLLDDPGNLRLRRFTTFFVGMVFPSDKLTVRVQHIAMVQGRQVLRVQVHQQNDSNTDNIVLDGEAEVEQEKTAYVFTGQGSQVPGMGMSLYKSSNIARHIWDQADQFFLANYGLSILDIVRNNPKSITIHFGGKRGRFIRQNYLEMLAKGTQSHSKSENRCILPGLTASSSSFTFYDSRGLIYATHFAQPAIILVEKAAIEHLKAQGVIQEGAVYAGHSLGEYGALAAFGDVLPFETMLKIVFYRGLVMQSLVERDADGKTSFSMVAVNPLRVGRGFNEAALQLVVQTIASASNKLLEIVNFNAADEQYVCAGHIENLSALSTVLDEISHSSEAAQQLTAALEISQSQDQFLQLINSHIQMAIKGYHWQNVKSLKRGVATTPLQGIDVPFHSQFLRPGVSDYRKVLQNLVAANNLQVELLVGKYIPNVTGRSFDLEPSFIRELYEVTKSPFLRDFIA